MPHAVLPSDQAVRRGIGVFLLLLACGVAPDAGAGYLRSGSLTWRPSPWTPRAIAFDMTVGMRRTALSTSDAGDLPVVGDIVDEGDVLQYGDGDCDEVTYDAPGRRSRFTRRGGGGACSSSRDRILAPGRGSPAVCAIVPEADLETAARTLAEARDGRGFAHGRG